MNKISKLSIITFILLFCLTACNDKTTDSVQPISKFEEKTTQINSIISRLGAFDSTSTVEILAGKRWIQESCLEYTEDWREVKSIFFEEGGLPAPGMSIEVYVFRPDGKLEDFTDAEYTEEEEYQARSWAFDPETRTLTIDGALSYHLIALGEDTFIWDYVDTWSSYHPRYFREVFKARAVE